MKIQFSPSDFPGSGQLIIRNSSTPGSGDLGFALSVSYKIGYLPRREGAASLLISLADGMAIQFESNDALCEHLNKDHCGYRPMTHDEMLAILGWQGTRFEGKARL